MDPDRYQMRDLKRRQATSERHIDRLEGWVRSLLNRVTTLEEIHASIVADHPPEKKKQS